MEEEKKETPEQKENVEVKKDVKVGWVLEGEFLVLRVPVSNPHLSMGIALDFLLDLRDRLSMARAIDEKRRQELAGKGTLKKNAIQNPSWFKKKFF